MLCTKYPLKQHKNVGHTALTYFWPEFWVLRKIRASQGHPRVGRPNSVQKDLTRPGESVRIITTFSPLLLAEIATELVNHEKVKSGNGPNFKDLM